MAAATPHNHRNIPAPPATETSNTNGPTRHQIEWAAAGLRRAAAESDITLPVDYARRVAASGLTANTTLGVTRLGAGVVIHTQSPTNRELPIVVGYADPRGQWYRDGSRHIPTSTDLPTDTEPGVAL